MLSRLVFSLSLLAAANALSAEPRPDTADSSQNPSSLVEMSTHHRPVLLIKGGIDEAIVFTDITATLFGGAYFVNFNLKPMNIVFSDDGMRLTFALSIEGGFNSKWLAVGTGLGLDETISYWGVITPGIKVTVPLRIGDKDGLHLDTTSGFAWHQGQSFRWEETDFRFGIPLPPRYELFFEGSVERKRLFDDDLIDFFAGVGLGIWLSGHKERGSMKLDIAIGAGGIATQNTSISLSGEITDSGESTTTEEKSETETDISVGPMVSLGLTWRF